MTTIAWDGRTMAADGRSTDDDEVVLTWRMRKIFRAQGELVGLAGDVAAMQRVRAWMLGGCQGKRPDHSEVAILVVRPDRQALIAESGGELVEVDTPCAIGSGRHHAVTAMDCGKTAAEAVALAMKRDACTGGEITTLRLKEKPCRKPKR